jgi:hypothetical protein
MPARPTESTVPDAVFSRRLFSLLLKSVLHIALRCDNAFFSKILRKPETAANQQQKKAENFLFSKIKPVNSICLKLNMDLPM